MTETKPLGSRIKLQKWGRTKIINPPRWLKDLMSDKEFVLTASQENGSLILRLDPVKEKKKP